jgi:hypothetical protein
MGTKRKSAFSRVEIPLGVNTSGQQPDIIFTEAQPCDGDLNGDICSQPENLVPKDLAVDLDNISDGQDMGDAAGDVIDNVEMEGDILDNIISPEKALDRQDGNSCPRAWPDKEDRPKPGAMHKGQLRQAPTHVQAMGALKSLKATLRPPRKKGVRHKDPKINPFVRVRMEGMETMLNLYTNPQSATYQKWGASACQAAISLGQGQYCACQLARLSRQFIADHTILLVNPYGNWNESMLVNEDIASDINIHLQELGKNISAKKVVEFLARPDVKERHGITKNISERTAS